MKKHLRFILFISAVSLGSIMGSEPSRAICWSCVGNWFKGAADTVANAFESVGHVVDDVVVDVAKVADSAIQLAETAVDEVSRLAATAATVVTNVVATAAGDITGDHTLFNNVAAHIDTAIQGAADEVQITTNALASLATAGIDTTALLMTHPQLAEQIMQYEGILEKDRLQAETEEGADIMKAEASYQVNGW